MSKHIPLLCEKSDTKNAQQRGMTLLSVASRAGKLSFAVLVWSLLVVPIWSRFHQQPAGWSAVAVTLGQGIFFLHQGYTTQEKKENLQYQVAIRILAYTGALLGAALIICDRSTLDQPQNTSFNEYFDSATLSYIVVQLVFGGIMSYIPSFFGGKAQTGVLWHYHRILGYLLLITLLNIAELGAQAGFMVNHIPRPNLLWLYWVSLAVVLVAIGKRTDASRCG